MSGSKRKTRMRIRSKVIPYIAGWRTQPKISVCNEYCLFLLNYCRSNCFWRRRTSLKVTFKRSVQGCMDMLLIQLFQSDGTSRAGKLYLSKNQKLRQRMTPK